MLWTQQAKMKTTYHLKGIENSEAKVSNLQRGSTAKYGRVVPSDEGIGSRKATSRIPEVIKAERHLETCLLESREIVVALRQILHDDNINDFCEDLRELLKYYYLDLKSVAKTNLQNATADMLRGHWYRERIAKQFACKLTGHTSDDSDEGEEDRPTATGMSISDLNEWITKNQSFSDPNDNRGTLLEDVSLDFDNSEDETSNSDGELSEAVKDLKYIKHMEHFAFQGKAFRNLLERIQTQSIQPQYHDLRRILMTLPDASIKFDDSSRQSWSDKGKCWVEEQSNRRWDWWPLRRRKNAYPRKLPPVLGLCKSTSHFHILAAKANSIVVETITGIFPAQTLRPSEATSQHAPDAPHTSSVVPAPSLTSLPKSYVGQGDTAPSSSSGNVSPKVPGKNVSTPSASSFGNQQSIHAVSIRLANDLIFASVNATVSAGQYSSSIHWA
jgi:hypothetical protein